MVPTLTPTDGPPPVPHPRDPSRRCETASVGPRTAAFPFNHSSTIRRASCNSMTTPPIIIISEPDPMISGVLRVEFSRWNFAVLLASSCEEAADYAAQTVAALIVLDSAKAQMAAYETCARIRRRPGYASRPIVLTGWNVSARTQAAATTAG